MSNIERENNQEGDNIRESNASNGLMHLTCIMNRDAYIRYEYTQEEETERIYYSDLTEARNLRGLSSAKFDSVIVSRNFLMLLTKNDLLLKEEDILNIADMYNTYKDDKTSSIATCFKFPYKSPNLEKNVTVRLYPHGYEGLKEENNRSFGFQDIALEILLAEQAQINMDRRFRISE